MTRWKTLAIALGFAALAACGSNTGESDPIPRPGALAQAFTTSAETARVPRDLILAIAAVEGGLEMPRIREGLESDAEMPAAGPLMLRRGKLDTLARGA